MGNLFMETDQGNIPIPKEIIEKYSLRKGTTSPFTSHRIVGQNGEYQMDPDPLYYAHMYEQQSSQSDRRPRSRGEY